MKKHRKCFFKLKRKFFGLLLVEVLDGTEAPALPGSGPGGHGRGPEGARPCGHPGRGAEAVTVVVRSTAVLWGRGGCVQGGLVALQGLQG